MNLTRQQREELNQLSLEVFGSSSRWKKLVENGFNRPVVEEIEEEVPTEDGKDVKIEKRTVLSTYKNGAPMSKKTHHTPESIKELMIKMKDHASQVLALKAAAQKEREEKAEKERLSMQIDKELGGKV